MKETLRSFAHDLINRVTTLNLKIARTKKQIHLGVSAEELEAFLDSLERTTQSIHDICTQVLKGDDTEWVEIESQFNKIVMDYSSENTSIDIRMNSPKPLLASPVHLLRSIENIVKNSIEQGASHIQIEVLEDLITIRDNGGGICQKIIQKLNAGEPITTKSDGHGIGLVNLRRYCQDMRWKLIIGNAMSDQGYGAYIKIKY